MDPQRAARGQPRVVLKPNDLIRTDCKSQLLEVSIGQYYSETDIVLAIKRFVLEAEQESRKLKKEVSYLEELKKDKGKSRPSIPKETRTNVWRRDLGRCVECGSKEHLEFDHIIPISQGGGNTSRNIQLLCENCNRKKSDKI